MEKSQLFSLRVILSLFLSLFIQINHLFTLYIYLDHLFIIHVKCPSTILTVGHNDVSPWVSC